MLLVLLLLFEHGFQEALPAGLVVGAIFMQVSSRQPEHGRGDPPSALDQPHLESYPVLPINQNHHRDQFQERTTILKES